MLRCRDVTYRIASGELESSSFWARLEVTTHLWMCRHCRSYSRQMRALGESARKLFGESALTTDTPDAEAPGAGTSVDPHAAERLERQILERLDRELG